MLASERPSRFLNSEGGSVEQSRDPQLLLRHCANYAAALLLFSRVGHRLRLLELGCGSGGLSAAFCRSMPPDWELLATDYSSDLVRSATQRHELPNLRFEQADAAALNARFVEQFDGIFLLEVIEHLKISEQRRLLTFLHERMRPGGLLLFSTLDRSPFPRPFSGYWPHEVEWTFRGMSHFLGQIENNPFRKYEVWRLCSSQMAKAAVEAENRGGYFLNRLAGVAVRLARGYPGVALLGRGVMSVGFRLYSLLPFGNVSNWERMIEDMLGGLSLRNGGESLGDEESFGMVVLLEKE